MAATVLGIESNSELEAIYPSYYLGDEGMKLFTTLYKGH
jgi:hypothetical protein